MLFNNLQNLLESMLKFKGAALIVEISSMWQRKVWRHQCLTFNVAVTYLYTGPSLKCWGSPGSLRLFIQSWGESHSSACSISFLQRGGAGLWSAYPGGNFCSFSSPPLLLSFSYRTFSQNLCANSFLRRPLHQVTRTAKDICIHREMPAAVIVKPKRIIVWTR